MSSNPQAPDAGLNSDLYRAPAPVRLVMNGISRLTPPLAVRLAAYLFARPKRGKVHGEEEATMARAEPFEMEVQGRRLACWRWGEGPIVFLHHGWGSRGSRLAPFVEPITSRGFQAVTYDAPAHGASEGRTTTAPEIGRHLAELERRLGGFHAVVAHSVGCWATAMAMRQGLMPGRVVFVSPPGYLDYFAEFFIRQLGFTNEVRLRMEAMFRERTGVPWETLKPEGMAPDDPPPLLVFHDRDDAVVPVDHARAVVAAWRGAKLIETGGLGHRRILRAPAVVARAVDFVTEGSPAAH